MAISSTAIISTRHNTSSYPRLYSLDNGVPYSTSEPSGIAVVRDWPIRTRDSEKLILAAAFGGWAFVLEETRDELPRFASRLKQKSAP